MSAGLTLVVVVESAAERRCCEAIDFAGRGIRAVPVAFAAPGDGGWPQGLVALPTAPVGSSGKVVPRFDELAASLEAERPDACLILGDGPGARLAAVAADVLGLPVFLLVGTADQLAHLVDRAKTRPNLFFVGEGELLPAALRDRRYGSTLLPTGRPGDPEAAAAGGRILDAIERWRDGRLDPAEPDVSVIVPSYREEKNVALVCDRLLAALEGSGLAFEILLVDDASPDDTYRAAIAQMWRSPRIRALTKTPPRGMGNAIRHGLAHARSRVVAVTMGDGSDEVARIPEMVARVRDEGYGLAIGSRYRHRANYQTVPLLYRFWSWCFRWCTRVLIGLKLSDYTNAFRVFHTRIFDRYGPESGGFELSPEITFKAWFATRKVTEVDVRHLKRAAGQSTFSFLRAGPGYGKILTKAFVNRLTGRWFTLDW